jgi:PAS domain S-box-containing protein
VKKKTKDVLWQDAIPCYVSVQDSDLRIIDTNSLFDSDFGDRLGEYCYQAYKSNDSPCPECPVLLTFKDGKVHSSEETVTGRNGEIKNVVVTSAPLFDEKGQVARVVEMSTNITEIKTLRQELNKTRRDFRHLFEAVPGYICVLNRDLQIQEANTLYMQDFDMSLGGHCYEACKGRNSQCPDCLVKKTFEDGQSHSSEERLNTRHGKKLDLVVHSMPIKDESGNITAVMEVFTDITEVKRLQRQLALVGRAVTGMAHRTKNILMGLEGGIFVVNTGMETDDRETMDESWEMVERNVSKVSRLVKDLLYCSKERKPKFKDDVCPHEVLQQVYELFKERAAEADIALELDLGPRPTCGTFDSEGLQNLLSNLVANAIDACRFDTALDKQSHSIVLSCLQTEKGDIVYEVADNGAGIPEEISDKVFEDFFSTKGTEGTGIGLLVVQKVAEEHGGLVTFTSRPGEGTRFTVTIPAPEGGKSNPADA